MSDGFRIPAPADALDPYESGGGGDLRWIQWATLGELAFAASLLPSLMRLVLRYGLWVPTDPLLLHRAADGWSAVSDHVQASGQALGERHGAVSPAAWQAPERQTYGAKVAAYETSSQQAAGSADTLSWILRLMANCATAGMYLEFAIATGLSSMALTAALGGPSRIFAQWQARAAAAGMDQRLMLRKLVVDQALTVLVGAGVAWVGNETLTDGLT